MAYKVYLYKHYVESLSELLSVLEGDVETHLRPSEDRVLVYCPSCFINFHYSKSLLSRRRVKVELKCSRCGQPLRVVDEGFYEKCSEWSERVRVLLERVFDILKSWSPLTGRLVAEVNPCEELKLSFEPPSHIVVREDGAYVYLHWLSERELDKLVALIGAVKALNTRLHVEVDSRWDHCRVPPDKMRDLGFKLKLNWHLTL